MSTTETPIEAPKSEKKKRVRGDAIARLAKASANKVRENTDKISDALIHRVLQGDVNCAKLLLTLIEKLPPPNRKHHSLAVQWLKSGPWQDPATTPSLDVTEDEESNRLDDFLGEEFVSALEKYRQAEREMASKRDAASQA